MDSLVIELLSCLDSSRTRTATGFLIARARLLQLGLMVNDYAGQCAVVASSTGCPDLACVIGAGGASPPTTIEQLFIATQLKANQATLCRLPAMGCWGKH